MKNLSNIDIVTVSDERTANNKIYLSYNLETNKTTAYISPDRDIKEQLEKIRVFMKERGL